MDRSSNFEIANETSPIFSNRRTRKKNLVSLFFAILLLLSTILFASLVTDRTIHPQRTTPTSPNLPHEILRSSCNKTHSPPLCFSLLSSIPSAKNATNHKQVLQILIDQTVRSVRDSHSNFSELISSRRDLGSRQIAALNDCLEMLETTVDELRTASQELRNFPAGESFVRRDSNLTTLLSAAMTNQDSCLEGFSGDKNGSLRRYLKNKLVPISVVVGYSLAMVKGLEDGGAVGRESTEMPVGKFSGGFSTGRKMGV